MTNQHAPTPWHVSLARGRSCLAIDDAKGLEIAILTRPHGTTNADASLLAAAPDLLAALRTIADTEAQYLGGDATRELARIAIAKAEGSC